MPVISDGLGSVPLPSLYIFKSLFGFNCYGY